MISNVEFFGEGYKLVINNLEYFETESELEDLTGATSRELWDAGFNLDDMDWGFRIKGHIAEKMVDENGDEYMDVPYGADIPYYLYHMLTWMNGYCVGYCCAEYGDYTYFTLHHS